MCISTDNDILLNIIRYFGKGTTVDFFFFSVRTATKIYPIFSLCLFYFDSQMFKKYDL